MLFNVKIKEPVVFDCKHYEVTLRWEMLCCCCERSDVLRPVRTESLTCIVLDNKLCVLLARPEGAGPSERGRVQLDRPLWPAGLGSEPKDIIYTKFYLYLIVIFSPITVLVRCDDWVVVWSVLRTPPVTPPVFMVVEKEVKGDVGCTSLGCRSLGCRSLGCRSLGCRSVVSSWWPAGCPPTNLVNPSLSIQLETLPLPRARYCNKGTDSDTVIKVLIQIL